MKNTTRCAIYVRKSVEDDVKKELTSLESQEIYCREFIRSHPNWEVSKVYCDNGYSGGNLNRPALKRLFGDIENNLIDTIVVYKYDRLTRSSMDYFFMSSIFQQHNVTIIAATEQIDASTPDGEFMMTNKMAIAQYERSITRVRVSEKISSSRKLGIWTGGTIPVGYKTVDKKLVIDEALAPLICFMFQRFVELRSPTLLASEINAKAALELSAEGMARLKLCYRRRMYTMLKCPVYKGYVNDHGTLYKGRHEAIVAEELWDYVQEILKQTPIKARAVPRAFDFALKSLCKCKECNKSMIVNLTAKTSKNYAYYTCWNKKNGVPCKGLNMNISAELIQRLVAEEVRKILKEPEILGGLWEKMAADSSPEDACKRLQNIDKSWDFLPPTEQNKVIQDFVKTVWISKNGLMIELTSDKCANDGATEVVTISGHFYNRKNRRQVFVHTDHGPKQEDPLVLKALVQAEVWRDEVNSAKYISFEDLAAAHKIPEDYVKRGVALAFLSPRIKEAILLGKLSPEWTLRKLNRKRPSMYWHEQEEMFLGATQT